MPFVSPVTVHEVDAVEQVAPPGLAVTMYAVIFVPPLLAGAFHETVASVSPAAPVTLVGGPETVLGDS